MTQKLEDILSRTLTSKVTGWTYKPSRADDQGVTELELFFEDKFSLLFYPDDDIMGYDPFVSIHLKEEK